jgi:hypothetical protein
MHKTTVLQRRGNIQSQMFLGYFKGNWHFKLRQPVATFSVKKGLDLADWPESLTAKSNWQQSWVRSQIPPTQWNLQHGGR